MGRTPGQFHFPLFKSKQNGKRKGQTSMSPFDRPKDLAPENRKYKPAANQ